MKNLTHAMVGDAIRCDDWPKYEAKLLLQDDGYKDSSFPGCQFRVKMFKDRYQVAVNIIPTGEPKYKDGCYVSRCKIEFVGDGEPSTFCGGIVYHHVSYNYLFSMV